jgi:hypothetical protein
VIEPARNEESGMTTTRSKAVRKTEGAYRVLYAAEARQVVVAILPGDVLEFREHGRRGRWLLAIDSAFRFAVRLAADAKRRERKAAKRVSR